MNIQVEFVAPKLAAFGAPIWLYKPLSHIGTQIAAAVLAAALGLTLLTAPAAVALTVSDGLVHDTAATTSSTSAEATLAGHNR